MDTILLVLQVFLAIAIIGLILLQKGKGASEGASFGGGGGGSVFGASGSSNFLSKSTAILATAFFINSLALAYLAGSRDVPNSVIDSIEITTDAASSTETSGSDVPPATDGLAESEVPAAVESDVPAPADAPVDSDVPPAAE